MTCTFTCIHVTIPSYIYYSDSYQMLVTYCSSVYIIGGITWIVLSLVVRVIHAAAFEMFSQHVDMEWKSGPQ